MAKQIRAAGWLFEKASEEESEELLKNIPDGALKNNGVFNATCDGCKASFGPVVIVLRQIYTLECKSCSHIGTVVVRDFEKPSFFDLMPAEIIDSEAKLENDPAKDPTPLPGAPQTGEVTWTDVIFVKLCEYHEIGGKENVIKTSPFTICKDWMICDMFGELSKTGQEYWDHRKDENSAGILNFAYRDIARAKSIDGAEYFLFRDKNYKKTNYLPFLDNGLNEDKPVSDRIAYLRNLTPYRAIPFDDIKYYLAFDSNQFPQVGPVST